MRCVVLAHGGEDVEDLRVLERGGLVLHIAGNQKAVARAHVEDAAWVLEADATRTMYTNCSCGWLWRAPTHPWFMVCRTSIMDGL